MPLVLLQHFTGTLDGWDPLLVDGLARTRRVLPFDNVGVGSSSGTTPDNVAQMALDAYDFISAMGLEKVDLLGYSRAGWWRNNWPLIIQIWSGGWCLSAQRRKAVKSIL